ncbi:MAG TPA: hypothetical protein VKU61_04755 [Candidatus Binatia bacterium]|nr:hypothetical protein [Candidatus Binatia bacterium]
MRRVLLPDAGVRVRRGRRRDLPQVQSLLGLAGGDRLARYFRRIVADLGTDFYVAEDRAGAIVGLVSVVYARSLVRGGISATLDGARATPAVLDGLLAFAEERARRRGCVRLTAAPDPGDSALRAALVARGYRVGELLLSELATG